MRDVGWAKLSRKAGQPAASFLSPMVSIFISILNSVPGVPTSFGQEFCKKYLNITKGEKICESLFTFYLKSTDLPSI